MSTIYIEGWRLNMERSLALSCPNTKAGKAGYLSALYCLRMNTLPPAYCRDVDTTAFQAIVDRVISRIEHPEYWEDEHNYEVTHTARNGY